MNARLPAAWHETFDGRYRVNESGCWEFVGPRGRTPNGYGKLGGKLGWAAHRLSLELATGEPLGNLFALHHCDNRPCIRPAHLFAGTPLDNVRDMDAKGRRATGERHWSRLHPESLRRGERHPSRLHPETIVRGEAHGCARLTEDQVRAIRAADGQLKDIAAAFGVSKSNVHFIRTRQTWSHVA